MRHRKQRLPAGEVTAEIHRLAHDGRGIASVDGKAVFVEGALPGETASFRYVFQRKTFDEAVVSRVENPAADRIEPACRHAAVCGGCSLQHLAPASQLALKQTVLREQLQHFGSVQPGEWLPPLAGAPLGYRRKARLAVRYVAGKGGVLVGFREKRNAKVADIASCAVLLPDIGNRIAELRALLSSLSPSIQDKLPQVEVAAGDDRLALVFRHLAPLADADRQSLVDWCRARNIDCWLQPGNESTMHRIWPEQGDALLAYRLDDFGVELLFHPNDFTQVNAGINRQMVRHAVDLLDPQPGDRVLDLFCGLGNFTLPLATRAAHVTGVEGNAAMVERGNANVAHNRARGVALGETRFFAANLDGDFTGAAWARERYDLILLDPARAGAEAVCRALAGGLSGARRIVYVSCNPATLARDAGLLAEAGYVLEKAGVMDMFPHTTHVESMALFTLRQTAGRR
ncbi:MAG: 23S rRNA (uracil(1939)-C(5))-methyltransferase RlmD [Pseudomonadota bacterium]